METIKQYLNAMFASMPNTPEVQKARLELLQMMEDKYSELIEEGASENAAVGTVISEFGNLDELAESLGLTKVVEEVHEREQERPTRFVSFEEVKGFLANEVRSAWMIAVGVFLCITSVIYPMVFEYIGNGKWADNIGPACMFISIVIGVCLFIFNTMTNKEWEYIKRENCHIDMNTTQYVKDQKRSFKNTNIICHTVGVALCILWMVPATIFDDDLLSGGTLFIFVGIGVLLLIYGSIVEGSFDKVLKINDVNTVGGQYAMENGKKYKSMKAKMVVELFWPTVTCLYLIVSFLTFRWDITWIVWVIGAVSFKAVEMNCLAEEE
ncbi:MAG: permease prefix domain 1-containing protein [Pseudobutyrivibrio sp.]|nr:permease prefix domain 1-containing protein [Pseudobutyrivibrio sp.]